MGGAAERNDWLMSSLTKTKCHTEQLIAMSTVIQATDCSSKVWIKDEEKGSSRTLT